MFMLVLTWLRVWLTSPWTCCSCSGRADVVTAPTPFAGSGERYCWGCWDSWAFGFRPPASVLRGRERRRRRLGGQGAAA